MAGELRLSQFKFSSTVDDDLVIGNPATAGDHASKFIVFQTDNIPGKAGHPYFSCDWNAGTSEWEFKMSQDGSNPVTLTGAAYLAGSPQTFTGNNTFSGTTVLSGPATLSGATANITSATVTITGSSITLGTLTSNTLDIQSATHMYSSLVVDGDLTINGTTTSVNTANLDVEDKLVTLNNGGGPGSGGLSGVEVEESGNATPGYIKTNAARTGWDFKSCSTDGITTIITGATNKVLTVGSFGTIAVLTDIAGNGSLGASSYVRLDGGNGVGDPQTVVGTIEATTFNGNLLGKLISLDLPVGAGSDTQYLAKSGTGWVWASPVSTSGFATLATAQTFTAGADKIFLDSKVTLQKTVDSLFSTWFVLRNTADGNNDYTTISPNRILSYGASAIASSFIVGLGLSGTESETNGLLVTRTAATNNVTLEVTSTGSAGSSLILKDSVTAARYKLSFVSGVLTQELL